MKYTKEQLLEEARKYSSYDDFILAVQTKLGVYDPDGNRMPIGDEQYKTQEGEDLLDSIHACNPGRGWFYVAANLWQEAVGEPIKRYF